MPAVGARPYPGRSFHRPLDRGRLRTSKRVTRRGNGRTRSPRGRRRRLPFGPRSFWRRTIAFVGDLPETFPSPPCSGPKPARTITPPLMGAASQLSSTSPPWPGQNPLCRNARPCAGLPFSKLRPGLGLTSRPTQRDGRLSGQQPEGEALLDVEFNELVGLAEVADGEVLPEVQFEVAAAGGEH